MKEEAPSSHSLSAVRYGGIWLGFAVVGMEGHSGALDDIRGEDAPKLGIPLSIEVNTYIEETVSKLGGGIGARFDTELLLRNQCSQAA